MSEFEKWFSEFVKDPEYDFMDEKDFVKQAWEESAKQLEQKLSEAEKKLAIAKIALEKYANTTGWDNAKITKDKTRGTIVASYTWAREALESIETKKECDELKKGLV